MNGTGFFPTLKDRVGGGMVHRHNSYISSQMKLKLGSNIIWIMFTSNSGGKVMTSLLFCFYDVIITFMTHATFKILTSPIFNGTSSNLVWG